MDTRPIKVLMIEDDPGSARLVQEQLRDMSWPRFELEHADLLTRGLERLAADRFDLVLLDMSLPDSHGFETFVTVHGRAPDVPVIVLSGLDDETLAARTVEAGAQDYLVKGKVDGRSLARAMQYAVERHRAEQALARERQLLRTLIDNLPDYIYVKDTASRFVVNNMAHARILGAAHPVEVIGKTDFDVFPRELAAHYYADEQELMRRGEALVNREEPVVDREGRQRWLLTTKVPLRDATGKVVGLVGLSRDITERKQAEQALRENQERTQLILETANDAFVEVDGQDTITDWNRQAEAIFGWTRAEAVGRSLAEMVIPPQFRARHLDGLRRFLAGGEGPIFNKRLEMMALHRDGHLFPIELTVWPLEVRGAWRFNAFIRDITNRKRAESELAAKNDEVQRDLQVAREFQEALMPREYPQVPADPTADPVSLGFHHIYKPALTVGGDFFDVVKLSDHRAGVFIADVMGHGARSALVTAILRTLWQGFVQQADDPGQFLALINQHFHDIIERASEFVFASAFYLILDTERREAIYASAGHPTPLVADRQTGKISPLMGPADNRPALGLMGHSRYLTLTRPIRAGQTFLLFTDGITEAPAASGEEFGRERLCRAIEAHLDCPVAPLMEAIVQSVNRHTGAVPLPDDICLVGVEVTPSLSAIPAERAVVQNVV